MGLAVKANTAAQLLLATQLSIHTRYLVLVQQQQQQHVVSSRGCALGCHVSPSHHSNRRTNSITTRALEDLVHGAVAACKPRHTGVGQLQVRCGQCCWNGPRQHVVALDQRLRLRQRVRDRPPPSPTSSRSSGAGSPDMPMTPSVVGSESVNRFRLECRRTRLDIDDSKDGTLPATETVAAESEGSESTAIDDKNSVDGRAPVSTLPISPLPTTLKNANDFDPFKNGGRKAPCYLIVVCTQVRQRPHVTRDRRERSTQRVVVHAHMHKRRHVTHAC